MDGSLPAGLIGSRADGLEIANGDDALVTFAQMAQGMIGADEMARKRAGLLEYCERDTLAIVRLQELLEGFVAVQSWTGGGGGERDF